MPLLGKLITFCMSALFGFMAKWFGTQMAIRVTAAITLGGIYLSCVVFYTQLIGPWFALMFQTAYGAVLGLLFPPISGTVVAGLSFYYTCVAGKRYTARLMKMAVG